MSSIRPRYIFTTVLVCLFALLAESAFATHFRYGYMFWQRDLTYSNPSNPNEVKIDFTLEASGRWTYTSWNAATSQGIVGATCPTPGNPSACCAGVISNYASSTFTSLSCPPVNALINFAGGVTSGISFIGTGPGVTITKRHGVTLTSPIVFTSLTATNAQAIPPGAVATISADVIVYQTVPVQDVFYGRSTFSMLMDKRFPMRVIWGNSNRVSELLDNNNDVPWRLETVVDLTGANANRTKSPITSSAPVVTVFNGQNNVITIPSQSFDNLSVKYRLATTAESYLNNPAPVSPSVFSLNPNTGVINFTPRTLGLYAVQVMVTEYDPNTGVEGPTVPIDFMFNSVTPNGTTTSTMATSDGLTEYTATVNQPFSFTVRSTMSPLNTAYTTTINHGVLPAGASMTASSCTGVAVCSSTFNWTPTVNSTSANICFNSTVTNGQVFIAQSVGSLCIDVNLVALATSMTTAPASGVAGGGPITLSATLKRVVDNAPLGGRVVKFTFDSDPNNPPWVSTTAGTNGIDTAVTDTNGVATLTVPIVRALTTPGTYTATFSAVTGELLQSSASSSAISIKAATTSMNVPTFAQIPTIGYPLTTSALLNRIYTDGGTLAIGADVQFTLAGPGGATATATGQTASNGVATVTFDPGMLPTPGPYTVQASFSGNANLFPNADGSPTTATTAPVTLKQRTQLTMPAVAATVGIPTTLTATLVAIPSGVPLVGRPVQISGANMSPATMTVTTDASGVATFPVSFSVSGNIVVTATYTPSSSETNRNAVLTAETDAPTIVVSKAATQLAFISPPSNVTINQPFLLAAQLTRTNTTGSVSGVTVTFTLRNSSNTLIGTRTGVTDANGNATTSSSFTVTTAGQYNVVVSSPATTTLNNATAGPLTINGVTQQATLLTVSPISTFSGSSTAFSATLTANGSPVAGESVSFTATGVGSLGSATTNASGVATVTAVAGAPVTGTVAASYAGSGTYIASSANAAYTVSIAATQLSLGSVPGTTMIGGTPLTIIATLTRTSPTAGPLSGASVTFTVTPPGGSNTTQTVVTAADGTASIALAPSARGVYTVAASYAGTIGTTASASAPGTVVAYQPVELSLNSPTGVAGGLVTITATLKSVPAAAAIAGQTVTISVNGIPQAAITDASGQATFTTSFPNAGQFTIEASFQGVADYYANHSSSVAAEITTAIASIDAAQTSLAALTVPATANVGNTLTASTTLTRISAPAGVVIGHSVTFALTAPGGSVSTLSAATDANGSASVTFPALATRGAYSLVATFAGNAGLVPTSTAPATVTVSQDLQLTVAAPPSAIAGAPVLFTATVNALPDNTPVTDPLIVTFTAGSQTAQATVSNGTAAASITFPNSGPQTVTASIAAGSGYLAASSNAAPFTVTPAAVSLSPIIVNASAFVGDSTLIAATLTRTSAPAGGVVGAMISFSLTTNSGNPPQQTFTAVTDANGTAQVSVPLSVRGLYHVTASFAGSSSLGTAGRSADFSVLQKTAVIVNAATGVATDPTNVFASLITLPGNAPLAGQTLNFDFGGVTSQGSAISNPGGVASLTRTFAGPGSYAVTASFQNLGDFFVDENGNQLPTTAQGTVTIQAVTTALSTMTVPASSLVGDDITVTTTLSRLTAPSGALAGRSITFSMDGGQTQTATTDASGTAMATFHIAVRGAYSVSASYAGSVAEVGAATSVTGGARLKTQIAVAQTTAGIAGVPTDVTATLVALPGGAMNNQLISFSTPGGVPASGSAMTDSTGVAHFTVTYSTGGSFPMTASFAADAGDFTNHNGLVAPEAASANAVVNKATAQLSAISAVSNGLVGQPVTLVTTLSRVTAPSGPWAGSVTFTVTLPDGSTQSIPATALSNGIASVSFVPGMRGVFSATASFDGDSSLNPASTGAVSVTAYQRTTLLVDPATGASHTPVTISATLTTVPGGATVSGQPVAFSFSDGSWATAATDSQGVARVTQSFATVGDVTVTATFANAAGFYADSTGAFPVIPTTAIGTVHVTNNAPTFTAPASITTEATGANGAVATFTAAGSDIEDGSIAAVCAPASGSTFPIGSTTVNCTVTDSLNAHVTGNFSVTVQDTTAPTLTLPTVAPASATSAAGRQVFYTATAADIVDASPTLVCTPASGSTFAIGSTTVNCTATDAHNNARTGSFNVSVTNNAPSFTSPGNKSAEATGANGAVVTFAAVGTDLEDGAINSAVCVPLASGATFPIGTTAVTCTVTDVAGATGSGTFNVTVVDTTKPVLTLPANITVDPTSAAGAPVTFTVSASDIVTFPISPVCSPVSGATFVIGTTTVNCSATDAANNQQTGSFTVTVRNPAQATQNLDTLAVAAGMGTNNVDNVLKFVNHQTGGSQNAACNNLDSIINKAQRANPPATAVITSAMNLKATLGCTP